MKLSLKRKLSIAILMVVIVLGGIATVGIFFYTKDVIFDLQRDNLKKIAVEQSHETQQVFSNILTLNNRLSEQVDIINYLKNPDSELQDENILEYLELYNIKDSFLAIYIMDVNGDTLVSTDDNFVGKNYGFRNYFLNALKGKKGVDISLGVTSNQLGYYFSAPIIDNNNVLGVMVMKMKPDTIHSTLDISSYSKESRIMMVDQFGVIVYSNVKDRIYKSLGELSENNKKQIEDEHRYDGISIEDVGYQEAQDALSSFKDVKILDIYDKEDHKNELLSINKMENLPFFIIIEEYTDVYLSPVINISYIISFLVILAALVSSIIIFIIISNFLRPLNDLKKATQDLSAGKLSVRVNIKTGDELQEVGDSFNKMAIKLQKNIEDIEKKIAERTANLEKLNRAMIGRELKMMELKKKIINLEAKKKIN